MNSAPHFCMPMARTSSATPSFCSSGRLAGRSDSPIWKRGWRAFSIRVTRCPLRASKAAAVEPAGPPPMTSTSVSMTGSLAHFQPPGSTPSSALPARGDRVDSRTAPAAGFAPVAGNPGFDEGTERPDVRVFENVGDLHRPRPEPVDALVDRDQLQRARSQIEQALIGIEVTPIELGLAQTQQFVLDLSAELRGGRTRPAETLELGQLRVECARQVFLFEQMPLHLA